MTCVLSSAPNYACKLLGVNRSHVNPHDLSFRLGFGHTGLKKMQPTKPQARAWTLSDLMLDGIGSFSRKHEPQFSPTLPPVSAGTRRRKPLCGPGPAANPVDDESWLPVDRLHLPVRAAPLEINTSPPSSSGGASSRRQSGCSARHRSGGGSSSRSTARSSMRSARTPRSADATGSEPATVDKDGGASNSNPFLRGAHGSPFTIEKDSARGVVLRLASPMGQDARAVAGATDASSRRSTPRSSRRSTPRSSRRSSPRRTGHPPVRSAALGAAALGSAALGSVALGSPTSSSERRDERLDVDGMHPSDTVHSSEAGGRSHISTSKQVLTTTRDRSRFSTAPTRLASDANADLNAELFNEARLARSRQIASAAAVCRCGMPRCP